MTGNTAGSVGGRGLGVAAALAGALTLSAFVVMLIWVVAMMAGGAGGFAIMAVMPIMGPIVLVLGIIGVILSAMAMSKRPSRRLGLVGLLLSATPPVVWLVALVVAMNMG